MIDLSTVEFVNPNTKQTVVIYAAQVFGITYLPTNACTVVTSVGGAAVPVDCTVEEAKKKINAALAAQGEKKDGI